MSKHIEWDNPYYIVNLTKQLVGERTVSELQVEFGRHCGARALYCFWAPKIAVQVETMNSETLGHIAAYATSLGAHREEFPEIFDGGCSLPKFINRTGIMDLFAHEAPELFCGNPKPRAMLEMLAVATIICILRDIILQKQWKIEATNEVEGMERTEKNGVRMYRMPLEIG